MSCPGDPPRKLAAADARALLLGHPLAVLGMLGAALASSLLWLFVAGYGLGFSSLRPLLGPRQRVSATVESSQQVRLWTGEPAWRSTAIFAYRGQWYRAEGYGLGDRPLRRGEAVRVLVPRWAPESAWIAALHKFPLRLRALAGIALATLGPALLVALWGIWLGAGQRRLLQKGSVQKGRRVRHLRLARPLSQLYLDRFAFSDSQGRPRAVWSLGPEGPEAEPLLVMSACSRAGVLSRLMPELEVRSGELTGTSRGRRLAGWAVLVAMLGQAGVLLLFFLT
jgi:hypothetical protein